MRHLIYALATGLLLVLAWPTTGFAPLLFIAFVPLLLVIREKQVDQKKSGWSVLGLSYLALFIFNIGTTYWLYYSTAFGMWFAVLVNSLLMALIFFSYYKILYKISFKQAALFIVLLWIGFEYLHLQWEFSWPWLNLGNAFSEYTSWIQWYEYTGTFGGTLWVWIGNFIVFKSILLFKKHKAQSILVRGAIKLSVCIALPVIISVSIKMFYEPSKETLEVVILQPNIDPYSEKYTTTDAKVNTLLTRLAKEKLSDQTSLVLAPETVFANNTSITTFSTSEAKKFADGLIADYPNLSIVSGISMFDYFKDPTQVKAQSNVYAQGGWYNDYNSAFHIDSAGGDGFYHKSKLVVGVENFPYVSTLKPILGDVMIDLGGTVAMKTTQNNRDVFSIRDSITTAPIICYESVYGEFVTGYVRNGANFLSIITNDAWWSNTQGHKQHFSYARLRAIETRRSVARSANTGISGFISETGEVLNTLGYDKQGSIKGEVTLNSKQTFYVRYGNYIARTSLFVLAFLFLYAVTRRRNEVY